MKTLTLDPTTVTTIAPTTTTTTANMTTTGNNIKLAEDYTNNSIIIISENYIFFK